MSSTDSSAGRAHARQHDAKGVAERYWEGMDRSMPQKLALMAGLMLLDKGALVVDAGCGSGAASYYLARLNPQVRVIGVDLDPQAIAACSKRYGAPNLSFQCGNVAEPLGLKADAILSSSTLHHVFTFAEPAYSTAAVRGALQAHAESLKDGGVLALRDFVVPDDPDGLVILSLRSGDAATSDPGTMDEPDLLLEFSRTARPLDGKLGPGFPVEELMPQAPGQRRFRLARRHAAEFLLRKDYRTDWRAELQEQYGYFTIDEFLAAFRDAGLSDARAVPVLNPWIVANRWAGKVALQEEDGRPAPWPCTNLLVSGRKAERGAAVRVHWQQALPPAGYLRVSHWRRDDGDTWTIAERPAPAIELLPWAMADGRLRVLARDGYPRPIATAADRRHPGRAIEPIAYAGDAEALTPLIAKLGLVPAAGAAPVHHLSFLPSAGGIAERAECYHLALETLPAPQPSTGPLARAGVIRSFDAKDILRAGQVGALDEARLEIATAFLLRQRGIPLDAWTGETPALAPTSGDGLRVADFATLLAQRDAGFASCAAPAQPWFALRRGLFKDVDRNGDAGGEIGLEWAEPFSGSPASASLLPLVRRGDGTVLVGIEMRALPAAQVLTGNGMLPCAPAWRLPARPVSADHAKALLATRIGLARPEDLTPLGGLYFSSLGITTERVYCFAGDIRNIPPQVIEKLVFCPLNSILASPRSIADGHLLIAASRAGHMLSAWIGGLEFHPCVCPILGPRAMPDAWNAAKTLSSSVPMSTERRPRRARTAVAAVSPAARPISGSASRCARSGRRRNCRWRSWPNVRISRSEI